MKMWQPSLTVENVPSPRTRKRRYFPMSIWFERLLNGFNIHRVSLTNRANSGGYGGKDRMERMKILLVICGLRGKL